MAHIVYILHSEKLNRFYIGETSDMKTRMGFHENALPHKFTAKAKDWKMFLVVECNDKKQAVSLESHIKRMKSSTYIKNLKKYPEMIRKLLQKYKS